LSDSFKSERDGPVNDDVHISFWDKIKGIFGPDKPPVTPPSPEQEGSESGSKPTTSSSTDASGSPSTTDTVQNSSLTSPSSEQKGSEYGSKPTTSSSRDTAGGLSTTDTGQDISVTSPSSEQEGGESGSKPTTSSSTDTAGDPSSTDTGQDSTLTSQSTEQKVSEYGSTHTGSSFTNTHSESSSPGKISVFDSISHPAIQTASVPSTSYPSVQPTLTTPTTPTTPTTTMKICPKTGETMTEITVLGEKIDVSSAGCYFDKGELARILGNKPSFLQSVWNNLSGRGNPYEVPDRGAEALVLQQKIQQSHARLSSLTAGTSEFDEEYQKLKTLKNQQNRFSS